MAENPNKPQLPNVNPTRSFKYNVPIIYDGQDNETYSGKISVNSVLGTQRPENDACSLWNSTRCSNDDDYCTPVADGDIIYHQFIINDLVPTVYYPAAYDVNGNALSTGDSIKIYRGRDKDSGNNYMNVEVNVSGIESDCFYLGLISRTCSEGYQECYLLPVEQQQSCLDGHCTNQITYSTDMYCKSDCLETLLVEGDYGNSYDCDGNFYGILLGQPSQFKIKFRVPATIEKQEYTFAETLLNGNKIKSTQTESWLFRTEKVPPYVVEMLAKVFNSKQTTIEGIDYKKAIKLSKNFDEGRMWIVSEILTIDCDEINFSCDIK